MSTAALPEPDYLDLLPSHEWVMHEARPLPSGDVRWTERHLHCLWYDERLRPANLTTTEGESLRIVHPGSWNLEVGPDFLGAVVRLGQGDYRLEGDVELHIRPGDWSAHGHAGDPRYARVMLHISFFPGPAPATLPPGCKRMVLAEACRLTPEFSFDDIDLAAYPHALLPLQARPCAAALGAEAERAERLLRAAGRHRLWNKTQRMAARLRQTGDRYMVFFHEILAGLGYKHNAGAMRAVARATAAPLLNAAETPPEACYARLLGAANLLPPPDACTHPESAAFARRLWDAYWRQTPVAAAAPPVWHLSHVRPLNHPLRRLAAAAALFADPRACLDALTALPADQPEVWFRAAARCLTPRHALPFWESRSAFDQPDGGRPTALLGRARVAALLSNVAVPLLRAEGRLGDAWIEALPAEQESAPMREMAARLLGRDHARGLYARHGLLQQGLLQLRADFCLRTREGCRDCPLPARIPAGTE